MSEIAPETRGRPRLPSLLVAVRSVGDLARCPLAVLCAALSLLAGHLALRLGFAGVLAALPRVPGLLDALPLLLPTLVVALLLSCAGIALAVAALEGQPLLAGFGRLPGLFAATALGAVAAATALLAGVVGLAHLPPAGSWLRPAAVALIVSSVLLICAAAFGATSLACGRLADGTASAHRMRDGALALGRALLDLIHEPLPSLALLAALLLLGAPLLLLAATAVLLGWLADLPASIALHLAHGLALAAWLLLWIQGLRRGLAGAADAASAVW